VHELDDYYVENTLGWLVDEVDDDESYALLSASERTAVLAFMLDVCIRAGGIEEWIAAHGPRSEDAILALRTIGAESYADALEQGFALFPNRDSPDLEARLAVMDQWSSSQVRAYEHAQENFLSRTRKRDLSDGFVRPFIEAHGNEFPQQVEDL
jgi:hypothetical protein